MNPIISMILTILGLNPSTDKAIKGIAKAVKQLEAVDAKELAASARHKAVAARKLEAAEAAAERSAHAARVRSKLADLVA